MIGDPFFDDFNASLEEAEQVMGEGWSFNGIEFRAVEIDDITTDMQAMPGGRFRNVSAVVHVRLEVFLTSGVKTDGSSIIVIRGDRVLVKRVEKDGDDARVLYCGPVQINTSGLL